MRRISQRVPVDDALLARVTYCHHRQHCGQPPTYAPHKTKCPRDVNRRRALQLLREGLRRSMVPPDQADLPTTVWAVDEADGRVYEARVTNPVTAQYHGFPVLDTDPLKQEIVNQWHQRAQ